MNSGEGRVSETLILIIITFYEYRCCYHNYRMHVPCIFPTTPRTIDICHHMVYIEKIKSCPQKQRKNVLERSCLEQS